MGAQVEIVAEEQRIRPAKSEVEQILASNAKALDLLGWCPRYGGIEGFVAGLTETIEWFVKPALLGLIAPKTITL